MRPEGCQETAGALAARFSATYRFQTIFGLHCLTLPKRGTYTRPMTNRRSSSSPCCSRRLRVVGAGRAPRAGAFSASIYVSVARRDRRAGRRPRPRRLRRARRQRRPRSPAASSRPASRCRSRCWSTTARPRATYIRDIRDGAAAVHQGARRGPTARRTKSSIIAHRRAADDPHRLHHRPGAAAEGRRSHLRDAGQRRLPARRHHRSLPGHSRSAKPPRPVIVAITTEGPGAERPRSTIRCSSRCATPAPRFTSSSSAARRRPQRRDAQRDMVLDEGTAHDRRALRRRC